MDPSENKKTVKAPKLVLAENSFEMIARERGAKKVETWDDKTTVQNVY